jgi:hypothetical protein
MKMVIFVFIVVVAAHACFVVARTVSVDCPVACPASVARMMGGASVKWLYYKLFFASSLLCVLMLISAFLSQEI